MLALLDLLLGVVAGLFCLILASVAIGTCWRGDFYDAGLVSIFALWMGYVSWNAFRRIRVAREKNRSEFAVLVSRLEHLSFGEAVDLARREAVPFPTELARRKFAPSENVWLAFERNSTIFIVERVGPEGRTKVVRLH